MMMIYRLLIVLLTPLLILVTLWHAIKFRDARFLRERLGFYAKYHGRQPLWIHAASVGEVIAIAPFAKALQQRSKRPIVITTCTPTGAAMVKQLFANDINHHYLPVDWHFACRRFMKRLRPRCGLIVETEIWPNLYRNGRRQGVPLLTINGRLSHKTLNTKGWQRKILRCALQNLTHVYARSVQDAEGFQQLGVDKNKITTLGNLKFSVDIPQTTPPPSPLKHPYVLAASTHDNEEEQLVEAWLQQDMEGLLVIAPRHPQRLGEILKKIAPLTDQFAVRSRQQKATAKTRIYLADTLGEMVPFMSNAKQVFMGGSLVPHGGHNILEPAALGKAILFGPSMYNFKEEAQLFLNAGAAIQVANTQELMKQFLALSNEQASCDSLGKKARTLLTEHQEILDLYLDAVIQRCQLEHKND